jgi:hypothetical protein
MVPEEFRPMTATIHDLKARRGAKTFKDAIELAATRHPGALTGVIVLFDEQGAMHTYYSCNYQELSAASARLSWIANTEG